MKTLKVSYTLRIGQAAVLYDLTFDWMPLLRKSECCYDDITLKHVEPLESEYEGRAERAKLISLFFKEFDLSRDSIVDKVVSLFNEGNQS